MTNSSSSPPNHKLVDLDNARYEDQRQVMAETQARGECPFCLEHLAKNHPAPAIKEGTYWFITPNQWPYEHTTTHLLAIHKTHIESMLELSPAAASELIQLFNEVISEHHYPGGAMAMRFGDTRYSAGSVVHLHAHLIVPDRENPEYQPIRFKIGSSPE